MRILFLRLLISWWLIPALWITFPFIYLLDGDFDLTLSFYIDATYDFWNGVGR